MYGSCIVPPPRGTSHKLFSLMTVVTTKCFWLELSGSVLQSCLPSLDLQASFRLLSKRKTFLTLNSFTYISCRVNRRTLPKLHLPLSILLAWSPDMILVPLHCLSVYLLLLMQMVFSFFHFSFSDIFLKLHKRVSPGGGQHSREVPCWWERGVWGLVQLPTLTKNYSDMW